MKKFLLIAALFLGSATAHGYSSPVGTDPVNSNHEQETRQVKVSTAYSWTFDIQRGHILSYASGSSADGYTVTPVGANTVLDTNLIACIAAQDIATRDLRGVVPYSRCITKGYVNFLRYDASVPFSAGEPLCVNTSGVAVKCAQCSGTSGNNGCQFGVQATANARIISMEAKTSGTGSDLKALVNLK